MANEPHNRWALVAALALSAVAWAAAAKPKLIVPDVTTNDPALDKLAAAMLEQVVLELTHTERFDVVSRTDIAQMLGAERQRQLLGCSDDSGSCMSEVGAALGAPYVVSGSLTRAGRAYRIALKLTDAKNSRVLAREDLPLEDETGLYSAVGELVTRLLADAPTVGARRPSRAPWVIGGVGLIGGVTGAVLLGTAVADAGGLASLKNTQTGAVLARQYSGDRARYGVGVGLAAGGAVCLAGAAVWLLLPIRDPPVIAAFAPAPSGGEVMLSGAW